MYGDIPPETLSEELQQTKNISFDPSQSLSIVFNAFKNSTDLAVAVWSPLTQRQCIDLVYVVYKKNGSFMRYLFSWDA